MFYSTHSYQYDYYQPDLQIGSLPPDPATNYYLYDRVVNVRDSFTVPLGYTGTVIAIHKPQSQKPEDFMYDIMFDKPFDGGIPLNCSQARGYRMSRTALINRSYGARSLEEKTGKAGHLIQQLTGANLHKIPIQTSPQINPSQQHIFIQPRSPQQPILHSPQQLQRQQNQETIRVQMQLQQIQQGQNFRMPYYRPQNSAFASWNQPMPNNFINFPCPMPLNAGFQMANFPITNQPRSMPMIPPVLEKKMDFMPNFIQNPPEVPVTSNPQHFSPDLNLEPKKVESAENVESEKNENEKECEGQSADADALKKILKINDDPPKQQEINVETTPLSVQDIFAYAARMKLPNASTLPLSPAVASSSLQLLSYYQTQGLGCPHYKYFEAPNGTHCQAQLTLPSTGEVVFGEPAISKELACENVAKAVLTKLKIKDGEPPATIPWFPTPPKQWCESDGAKNSKHKQKQPHQKQRQPENSPQHQSPETSNRKNHKQQNKKAGESGDVKCKSSQKSNFVPLQAVKQQRIHKTSVSNDNIDQGNNSKTENKNKEKKVEIQSIPNKNSTPDTKTTKPRRERKMRIAANFSASPKVP